MSGLFICHWRKKGTNHRRALWVMYQLFKHYGWRPWIAIGSYYNNKTEDSQISRQKNVEWDVTKSNIFNEHITQAELPLLEFHDIDYRYFKFTVKSHALISKIKESDGKQFLGPLPYTKTGTQLTLTIMEKTTRNRKLYLDQVIQIYVKTASSCKATKCFVCEYSLMLHSLIPYLIGRSFKELFSIWFCFTYST